MNNYLLHKFFILAFIFLKTSSLFSQQNVFTKIYSSPLNQINPLTGNAIIRAVDHGYVVAAVYQGQGSLIKLDSIGNCTWTKTYSFPVNAPISNLSFKNIITTSDSCYIVAGGQDSSSKNSCLMKINKNGNAVWAKTITGYGSERVIRMEQSYDKGFIMIANNNSASTNIVIKVDSTGNLEWKKTFSVLNLMNYAHSIKQLPDSSFIVLAYTETSGPGFMGYTTLINLSPTGNVNWIKIYNRTSNINNWGFDMTVVEDGMIFYLNIYDPVFGFGLMKTDFSGNILWNKKYKGAYGTTVGGIIFPNIKRTWDKGFVLANNSSPFGSKTVKVDSVGNFMWANTYTATINKVITTRDKGYILISNFSLLNIIKMDSLGNTSACLNADTSIYSLPDTFTATPATITFTNSGSSYSKSTQVTLGSTSFSIGCAPPNTVGFNENEANLSFKIAPNPFCFQTTLTFNQEQKDITIQIIDLVGNEIKTIKGYTGTQVSIEKGEIKPGIYILKIINYKMITFSKKIVIE